MGDYRCRAVRRVDAASIVGHGHLFRLGAVASTTVREAVSTRGLRWLLVGCSQLRRVCVKRAVLLFDWIRYQTYITCGGYGADYAAACSHCGVVCYVPWDRCICALVLICYIVPAGGVRVTTHRLGMATQVGMGLAGALVCIGLLCLVTANVRGVRCCALTRYLDTCA